MNRLFCALLAAAIVSCSEKPQKRRHEVVGALAENLYFAKPGHEAEVERVRKNVCDVLVANGFPRGTLLVGPGGDGPMLVWRSAVYHSHEALDRAMRRQSVHPEVAKAVDEMRGHTRRFEGRRYTLTSIRVNDDPGNPDPYDFRP